MVPTTGVEGAKQLIIRTKRWFRSPESDEEAAVALVDTVDFCGPARRGESALGPRQEMSCAKGARSSSGSSSFSRTCRFDSGATRPQVMGWHTTSRLTWRPITALVSDETWAELRLTNAAFACSHESRRAASRQRPMSKKRFLCTAPTKNRTALLPNNRTRDLGTNIRSREVSCSAVVRIFPSRKILVTLGSKPSKSGRLLPEGAQKSTQPGR